MGGHRAADRGCGDHAPYDAVSAALITRILILAILAMSVDLLLGFTGLSSMGQAAYLGLRAYLAAILATRCQFGLGWDFLLVILLGILLGVAAAAFSASSHCAPAGSIF
jgi:ABC-type branched-subunit amino acid transport system permease subunit